MQQINVTSPSMAPLEKFVEQLRSIWESGILTHNGPHVQRLERDLSDNLGISDYIAVTNGTVALQMAIKALKLQGEIITPAFTWIATVSAIKGEGCTPVFCDIDENTLNISTKKIEDLITEKTVAIMPVHVFGNPCNIVELQKISVKYKIPIIYDAAHALGSQYLGKSILEYGDVSAVSTHATKIFNTGEGGGLYSTSEKLMDSLRKIRFFGYDDQKHIVQDGFNGKMSEIHAALGIVNLENFSDVLADRKLKWNYYRQALSKSGVFKFQDIDVNNTNYSYFPIILKDEATTISLLNHLAKKKIVARRYFYPSLNTVATLGKHNVCEVSERISKTIICLPLYFGLMMDEIRIIVSEIEDWLKYE
mgnify:CR=1 FL=1